MPADPNKLPSPAPFPSQQQRLQKQMALEAMRAKRGRPKKQPDGSDGGEHDEFKKKWLRRRMISFRMEHVHWHNVRWFARKDRVSRGEYMKNAIMLYNMINFYFPLNKRLLLDLDQKMSVFLEWYRRLACQNEGDPVDGARALWEAPFQRRQMTDEEKRIIRAINKKVLELNKYAHLEAESEVGREEAVARQEEQVAGDCEAASCSIAQSSGSGEAAEDEGDDGSAAASP